jgi:hypothetical protein
VVLGVELETVRNVAGVVMVVLAVLALLAAMVVKAVVSKLVLIVVLAIAALVVWTNRQNLSDCAAKVGGAVTAAGRPATCHFLWFDVDVA